MQAAGHDSAVGNPDTAVQEKFEQLSQIVLSC